MKDAMSSAAVLQVVPSAVISLSPTALIPNFSFLLGVFGIILAALPVHGPTWFKKINRYNRVPNSETDITYNILENACVQHALRTPIDLEDYTVSKLKWKMEKHVPYCFISIHLQTTNGKKISTINLKDCTTNPFLSEDKRKKISVIFHWTKPDSNSIVQLPLSTTAMLPIKETLNIYPKMYTEAQQLNHQNGPHIGTNIPEHSTIVLQVMREVTANILLFECELHTAIQNGDRIDNNGQEESVIDHAYKYPVDTIPESASQWEGDHSLYVADLKESSTTIYNPDRNGYNTFYSTDQEKDSTVDLLTDEDDNMDLEGGTDVNNAQWIVSSHFLPTRSGKNVKKGNYHVPLSYQDEENQPAV